MALLSLFLLQFLKVLFKYLDTTSGTVRHHMIVSPMPGYYYIHSSMGDNLTTTITTAVATHNMKVTSKPEKNDTYTGIVLGDKPYSLRALDSRGHRSLARKIILIQHKWSVELIGLVFHLMSSSPEYIEVFERHSGRYYSSLVSKVRTHGLIGRNTFKEHLRNTSR